MGIHDGNAPGWRRAWRGLRLPLGSLVPQCGDVALARFGTITVPVEQVKTDLADRYEEQRWLTPRAGNMDKDFVSGDVRTLAVDYDSVEKRYKEFKQAAVESKSYVYRDSPLEGPQVCLDNMTAMSRVATNPMRWLERWLHEKGFSEHERLAHETRPLCEILHYGATYGQLNLGGAACLEVATRRLQAIVDAHSVSATRPNWALAKFYSGAHCSLDVSSDSMKKYATRMANDEFELQLAANRVRDLRGGGVGAADSKDYGFGCDDGAADGSGAGGAQGGGQGSRGGGKDGKSGRARRLKAEGSSGGE